MNNRNGHESARLQRLVRDRVDLENVRYTLRRLANHSGTPQGLASAARMILGIAAGSDLAAAAKAAGIPREVGLQTLRDYERDGLTGLKARLSGVFEEENVEVILQRHRLVVQTVICCEPPADSDVGWTVELVAKRLGLSLAAVETAWALYDLSPADTLLADRVLGCEARQEPDESMRSMLERFRGRTRGELLPPDEEAWAMFLQYLRDGNMRDTAASLAGISAEQVMQRAEHDQQFVIEIRRAEAMAQGAEERAMHLRATGKAKRLRVKTITEPMKDEDGDTVEFKEVEAEREETTLEADPRAAALLLGARSPARFGKREEGGGSAHVTIAFEGIPSKTGIADSNTLRMLEKRTGQKLLTDDGTMVVDVPPEDASDE